MPGAGELVYEFFSPLQEKLVWTRVVQRWERRVFEKSKMQFIMENSRVWHVSLVGRADGHDYFL